jgi:hypothetical protein
LLRGLVGAVDVRAQWRGVGFEGWRGGVVGCSVGRHGVVEPSLSCGRVEVGRSFSRRSCQSPAEVVWSSTLGVLAFSNTTTRSLPSISFSFALHQARSSLGPFRRYFLI